MRACTSQGRAETERENESEAGSLLVWDLISQTEIKSRTLDRLSRPAPPHLFFFFLFFFSRCTFLEQFLFPGKIEQEGTETLVYPLPRTRTALPTRVTAAGSTLTHQSLKTHGFRQDSL